MISQRRLHAGQPIQQSIPQLPPYRPSWPPSMDVDRFRGQLTCQQALGPGRSDRSGQIPGTVSAEWRGW